MLAYNPNVIPTNMKHIITPITLFSFILIAQMAFAQNSVPASEIIEKARNGESISYENVTITGDLDFTFYFEKRNEERYSDKKRSWSSNDNAIEENISSKVVFVNCTFEDGVLAYINDDRTDYTFTASFENAVVFKDCKFQEESAFKYSDFDETVDFSGSQFSEEALFKYAKFNEYADFHGAVFKDDANFKYTKFREGLNFSNASFQNDLNLKYAKIEGVFKSDNMDIQDDLDVKYTEINGEKFSKYLIKSR
jgi:uncharacterized protein YjbI with pentapeptide repeats